MCHAYLIDSIFLLMVHGIMVHLIVNGLLDSIKYSTYETLRTVPNMVSTIY